MQEYLKASGVTQKDFKSLTWIWINLHEGLVPKQYYGNQTHLLSLDGGPVCPTHIGLITSKWEEIFNVYWQTWKWYKNFFPQYHIYLLDWWL